MELVNHNPEGTQRGVMDRVCSVARVTGRYLNGCKVGFVVGGVVVYSIASIDIAGKRGWLIHPQASCQTIPLAISLITSVGSATGGLVYGLFRVGCVGTNWLFDN